MNTQEENAREHDTEVTIDRALYLIEDWIGGNINGTPDRGDGSGIEYDAMAFTVYVRSILTNLLSSLLSSQAGEQAERRKKQIIVEKFNDGMWWCMHGPECEGMACTGHTSFYAWAMAVNENIKEASVDQSEDRKCGYCPKHEALVGKYTGKHEECCKCHPVTGRDHCSWDEIHKMHLRKTTWVARCVCGEDVFSDNGRYSEDCASCGRSICGELWKEVEVANITKETL